MDPKVLHRAAQITLTQMAPRIITLVNAIEQMGKDMFPENQGAHSAVSIATTDMAVALLITAMAQRHPEMKEIADQFHKSIDRGLMFAEAAPNIDLVGTIVSGDIDHE